MDIYASQIENLKFNFTPLRRLWISNKWITDANLDSQRVTIETFCQEIQSKDNGSWGLTHTHFENLKSFLNTIITTDRTPRQLEAIGLGRSCGTYFINSSLIANLTNITSEYYKWRDLSDLVIYFSLKALSKTTDDKVTDIITERYNAEIKLRELRKNPEQYKAYQDALLADENAKKEQEDMKKQSELVAETIEKNIQKHIDNKIQSLVLNNEEYIYKGRGDIASYAKFGTQDGIFRIKKEGVYAVEVYLHLRNFNYWNNIYIEHYKDDTSLIARICIIDVVQNWDYKDTSKHQISVSDNDYLRLKLSANSDDITWKSECYMKMSKV